MKSLVLEDHAEGTSEATRSLADHGKELVGASETLLDATAILEHLAHLRPVLGLGRHFRVVMALRRVLDVGIDATLEDLRVVGRLGEWLFERAREVDIEETVCVSWCTCRSTHVGM